MSEELPYFFIYLPEEYVQQATTPSESDEWNGRNHRPRTEFIGKNIHPLKRPVMEQENQKIKEELDGLITTYYDGSFARLVREYIHTSEITEEEREALVEAVKQTPK